MGMFDEIRSDYPISPDYNLFQTKDIDPDTLMSLYYIDRNGLVWFIDYHDTSTWKYDDTRQFPHSFVRKPNGNHGRVRHMSQMTKYITLLPSAYRGSWNDIPIYVLHIIDGKVQSHKLQTSDAIRDQRNYRVQS